MWSGSGLPVANFTGSPVSGAAPLTVQFTDHSSNAETWQWNFGDGGTSAEQNPSHTYTGIGQHTVVLEVGNAIGSDTNTRVHYIHVRDLPPSPPDTSENFTLRDNGTTVSDIGDVRQVSFNATIGNGTVSGNDIILTNENLNVTIRTDGLNTSGNVSTGNVTGVLLDSSPVNASVGTGAGNISVSFNASMGSYNPDLQIQTSIYDQPSSEASTAFSLAAAADGETITTIAYAVYLQKTNMSAATPSRTRTSSSPPPPPG
jgi:PKD repeat protein